MLNPTRASSAAATVGPFSPIADVLASVCARIRMLGLTEPDIDGHLVMFDSRADAIVCASRGVFAVDPDPDYWDLTDDLEACDAYAFGIHRFTICWPVTS